MEFEKLVSPSLKDLFISHIEAMILSGELPVGQQLPPERQLAQSMGVSRAVVNSGVVELERRGFLEIRPRVGTFVADYRRAGTLETLKSIMTYNRGRLRNEEIRSSPCRQPTTIWVFPISMAKIMLFPPDGPGRGGSRSSHTAGTVPAAADPAPHKSSVHSRAPPGRPDCRWPRRSPAAPAPPPRAR